MKLLIPGFRTISVVVTLITSHKNFSGACLKLETIAFENKKKIESFFFQIKTQHDSTMLSCNVPLAVT